MTYALGTKSLSFVSHVDPRMVAVAKLACTLSAQDFGFTEEQSRTLEYQKELVAKGVSKTTKSHHIIDCAPGWAAPGFSGAVDAVPWSGGHFVWNWNLIYPIAEAFQAASIQLATPITWGGCWDRLVTEWPAGGAKAAMDDYIRRHASPGHNPFVDGPHMQLGRN